MSAGKKICLPNAVTEMGWGSLTIKEMDLQMCILQAIIKSRRTEIQIDLSWLKKTTGIQNYEDLRQKLEILSLKMSKDDQGFAIVIDLTQQTVTVSVPPNFMSHFIDPQRYPYFQLDMTVFMSLHKQSAKVLYMQICRYSKQNWWRVDVDKLKILTGYKLNTPNKYIMRDVIKPAICELQRVNPNIDVSCKAIKSMGSIKSYYFSFVKKK